MSILDNFLGGTNVIKAVGDIADTLITTDKERLELDIKRQELKLKETELFIDYQKNDNDNISKRWGSDMSSDSWLSKNIRPLTLIYILTAYTLFSIGGIFNLNVPSAYVELLGQWGMLIMSAYFGGRTIEKVVEMRGRG